jgi:carotenoid cleavage dioxygenase-like enzyme
MTTLATPFTESFTLDYRPEQQLLVGRWLQPVSLDELKAHYGALLDAAVAHGNCRRWLLDVRRRDIHNAAAIAWFADFGRRLPKVLGQPVALAYFAMVDQRGAAVNDGLRTNIQQGAEQGSSYRYFNHEQEALDWLLAQP